MISPYSFIFLFVFFFHFIYGNFSIKTNSGTYVHFFKGKDSLLVLYTSKFLQRFFFVQGFKHFSIECFVQEKFFKEFQYFLVKFILFFCREYHLLTVRLEGHHLLIFLLCQIWLNENRE